MTAEMHPTASESLARLWNRLPSLWRTIIPALGGLFIVLMPATALISARFYAVTDDNLRDSHERVLSAIGGAFDELITGNTVYHVQSNAPDAI